MRARAKRRRRCEKDDALRRVRRLLFFKCESNAAYAGLDDGAMRALTHFLCLWLRVAAHFARCCHYTHTPHRPKKPQKNARK
jgi:hypothetical protein